MTERKDDKESRRTRVFWINILCLVLGYAWAGSSAQAQALDSCHYRLEGRLVGIEEEGPVVHAYVRLLNQAGQVKEVLSDLSGEFLLEGLCSQGPYVLQVWAASYEPIDSLLQTLRPGAMTLLLTPEIHELTEMHVDAIHTESSQSGTSLGQSDLLRHAAGTFADALEQLPGVVAARQGGALARPLIDGMQGERISILQNGIVQQDQQWSNSHAPAIGLLAQERVTVLTGPGLLRYGAGALGGAVVVHPTPLPYARKEIGIEGLLHYATNGRQSAGMLRLKKGFALGKHWQLAAVFAGTGKLAGTQYTPQQLLENTAQREENLQLRLGLRFKQRYEQAWDLNYYHQRSGILRLSHLGSLEDFYEVIRRKRPLEQGIPFSYRQQAPRQSNAYLFFRHKSKWQLGKRNKIEGLVAYQQNERREYVPRRLASDKRPATHLILETVDASLFGERHAASHRFLSQASLGGQYQINRHVPGTGFRPFLLDYVRQSYFAFFSQTMFFSGRSSLELAGRVDGVWQRAWVKKDSVPRLAGHMFSAYASYLWEGNNHWGLHLTLGFAERIPHAHERFSKGVHPGSAFYEKGDIGLTKERGLKTELRLHYQLPNLRLEGRAYYQLLEGYIYAAVQAMPQITIRGVFPVRTYEQHDAYLGGASISARYTPWDFLNYQAQASLVRGWNRSLKQPLVSIPADRLMHQLELHTMLFHLRWRFNISQRLVARQSRYPADLDLAPPPAGYQLLGAQLLCASAKKTNEFRWELSLTGSNLLNTRYKDYLDGFRYFTYGLGVNVVLGLRFHL